MYRNPINLTIAETAEHFGCEGIVLDAISHFDNADDVLSHIVSSKVQSTSRRHLGFFRYVGRQIALTEFPRESEDAARDTFLHECAHLFDYELRGRSGHDVHWKRWARFLGCRPSARSKQGDSVWWEAFRKSKNVRPKAACTACGHVWERQRRSDFGGATHTGCKPGAVVNIFRDRTEALRFPDYYDHYTLSSSGEIKPIEL